MHNMPLRNQSKSKR